MCNFVITDYGYFCYRTESEDGISSGRTYQTNLLKWHTWEVYDDYFLEECIHIGDADV